MNHFERLLVFLLFLSFVYCNTNDEKMYKLEGRILGLDASLEPEAKTDISLILQGDETFFQTIAQKDGKFQFFVPKGAYLLQVISMDYIFNTYRVEISAKTNEVKVSYGNRPPGQDAHLLPYPMRLQPEGRADYFMIREGFQLLSYLKSPMAIVGLLTVGLAFVLPKMSSGLDTSEALAELQGQSGEQVEREPPVRWTPPPLAIRGQ